MAQNRVAQFPAPSNPIEVVDAPIPKPGPGEVLIKNKAIAVNPIDWKIQHFKEFQIYVSKWPFSPGLDAAGTVEAVGAGVTNFKPGQRVIANLHVMKTGNPVNAACQLYTVADARLTAAIPDSLSFEQAVVLPLAFSTAASGLYLPKYLGLPLPSTKPVPLDKTILIWGGASSVGLCAIQLAVASGLKIVTTASPANHDLVRSLGASSVFDYKSPSVVTDIIDELKTTQLSGVYDAISEDKSFKPIASILKQLKTTVGVAGVLPFENPTEEFAPFYGKREIQSLYVMVETNCPEKLAELVEILVHAFEIAFSPYEQIGEAVWGDFLPRALASGQLKAKPDAIVVGHGLEHLQEALDLQMAGVSAKKVVLTL